MIQSPKVISTVQAFHEDWLGLSALDNMYKEADTYPEYNIDLAEAFRTETQLFITEVFWMQNPTWEQLLSAPEGWINSELSELYDMDPIDSGWHRVAHDENIRPGVPPKEPSLAAQANAASSSPVKRGAFILRQLLCQDLEPPRMSTWISHQQVSKTRQSEID